jgi:hypothetical protein
MMSIFDDVPSQGNFVFKEEQTSVGRVLDSDTDGGLFSSHLFGQQKPSQDSFKLLFGDGHNTSFCSQNFQHEHSPDNKLQEPVICHSSILDNLIGYKQSCDLKDSQGNLTRTRDNTLYTPDSISREKIRNNSVEDKITNLSQKNHNDTSNFSNQINFNNFEKLSINKEIYNKDFDYKTFVDSELSKLSKSIQTPYNLATPNN